MNEFMGDLRSAISSKCPDAFEDYEGHVSWWRALHSGYEGFCLQGQEGCRDNEERVKSTREFEALARAYLMETFPEWEDHVGRLSRMSLYKRSYTTSRLRPPFGVGSRKAEEKQHKTEFMSRLGISNSLAEIAECEGVRTWKESLHNDCEASIIIGIGLDDELVYTTAYKGHRTSEHLHEQHAAMAEHNFPLKYPTSAPFYDKWKDSDKNSLRLYRGFGDKYWDHSTGGKRWFLTSMFGHCQNTGFRHNETGLFISAVREDYFRRMPSLDTGLRWITKDYFLSDEGSNVFYYIEQFDHPEFGRDAEEMMDDIEFFANNCKFITAIYADDGSVTLIHDKFVDIANPVRAGHSFYLDCHE
jgi:hypothetical protein